MILGSIFAATSFGMMAAIYWLVLGGTMLSALAIYAVSGQLSFISLVAYATLRDRHAAAKDAR